MKATIEKTADGYSAYLEYEEHFISSVGNTMGELITDFNEALDFTIEEMSYSEAKKLKAWEPTFVMDMTYFPKLFPTIDVTGLAKYIGLNGSLMRQYFTGKKKPSLERHNEILNGIHKLGEHYKSVAFKELT